MEADFSAGKNALFVRAELVEKSGEDLGVENREKIFNIAAIGIGTARKFYQGDRFFASLGMLGTVNLIEERLKPFYGDLPLSFQVFIRLPPH